MAHWIDEILANELTLPNTEHHYGVTLDREKVLEAKKFLGVKLPVIVKWSSGKWTYGCHRFLEGGNHSITISRYRLEHDVTNTLWHELCHAKQAEECGEPWDFYTKFYKPYGISGNVYWQNPYEVEARRVGAEGFSLTK